MSDGVDDGADQDPVDALVERFLQRRRAGDAIDVDGYCAEHPAHGDALRELLPMLLALEDVKRDRSSSGSGRRRASVPQLERLGDFKIVRELGRGGMGVVFEAVQESLGRKVALKVLPQASLLTGNQLERFVREAQIAAQLHHSNIVPVFGSGESDGYHWYAMQFIVGQSLEQWRQEQQEAPPRGAGAWRARGRFVARLGVQAASALHCAHGLGTLHRDIKPGNLLLEHNDHLWVTDFGLAKALEAEGLTHSGDVLGTLQYMAPEQFAGSYDARSEVYALGVTLYELLTLRPAFAGASRSELMERIRTQRPESLRKLCPELATDLVVVVDKAMARDPQDRYQDAAALAADLQAFLDERAIAARRLSAVAQVWRWCRRNRGTAALAGSTLLAVVGAAVTGWVAFGVTDEALARAEASAALAAQESQRADTNLKLALAGFGDVFDALVGRDPTLALEVDPDTGEQTVITRQVVDPRSIDLLQRMLRFYHDFASKNEGDQQLRFETARANRRVGAIHVRLGKPENLDSARKAYEQALTLLATMTDRDVSRELAAVYVDLGRLEHRRSDLVAAAQRFGEALRVLESERDPAPVAVRFERAQAHFLSAQLADVSGLGGMRPGGPRAPTGPAGRRELDRLLEVAQQHLQAALATVTELLAGDATNAEFRALQARCLLLSGRLPEGRRGDRGRDPENEARRERGLGILRELLVKSPQADHLRFALAEALLGDRRPRRRDDPDTGGPGGSAGGGRPAQAPSALDLERLREAKEHAALLVKEQPRLDEYKALQMRAALQSGLALRELSDDFSDGERAAHRARAVAEFEQAIATGEQLVGVAEPTSPRYLRDLLTARRQLANLLLIARKRDAAMVQHEAIIELLEQQVRLLQPAVGAPPLPFFDPGDREFEHLAEQVENLGRLDLAQRMRDVREAWLALRPRRPR